MSIPTLNDDLKKVQALGDNPNSDNNMTAEELKAVFDAASLIIQAYINGTLVPAVNANTDAVSDKVSKTGDAMNGALDMAGHGIGGLPDPTEDDHAARKAYVDNIIRNVVGFTGAHSDLTGRNAADQHPIAAIIGLAEALAKTNVDAGSASLPIYFKGGVPRVCGAVAEAEKLANARTFLIDLSSGTAVSFDGSEAVTPGVTGVLPIKNGGTGKSNGADALAAMLAAGKMVLSSHQYGPTLPASGVPGQVFFKKL